MRRPDSPRPPLLLGLLAAAALAAFMWATGWLDPHILIRSLGGN